MATQELTFNKKTLDAAEHLGGQATRYRDVRYPNLYLEVGARSKTWRFRKFWKGANFTETLGTWPEMTVVEASQKAAKHSDGIEEKGVVIKQTSGALTLRVAFEDHTQQRLDPRQKKLEPVTVAGYESILRTHVPRWLDMPLTSITRQMINEQIKAMSDQPATATNLLRALSAIYGTQLAYRDGFDHDPTYRVKGYPGKKRPLLFDEAKRWPALDAIGCVPNVTRRAAWLALLFTGLRMRNVRQLKWQDVDLDEKVIVIERMKNGERRTFPLSDIAVELFSNIARTHDNIVFESRHYGKPIVGLRQITLDGKDVNDGGILRPHDCRHLFSSAAAKVGLSEPIINWMRGDITIMRGAAGRYMHDLGSHDMANAIAQQIVSKCGPKVDLVSMLERA